MREITNTLRTLNLQTSTEDDIIQIFSNAPRAGAIITEYHPAYGPKGVPNLFVRASNYNPTKEIISNTDRLTYPPLEFNKEYQRASTPSQPMFYAVRYKSLSEEDSMSAIKTCLLETIHNYDELIGQRVAISLRYNIQSIKLFSIFNWIEFQSRNPEHKDIVDSFNSSISSYTPELIESTKEILNYLSERFHIPVGANSYNYKPSSIITQYLLNKLSTEIEIDGVVFPSTKVLGKEVNVALIPNKSDEKLHVAKVLDCEYKKNRIVEIQKRADIKPNSKEINFTENVNIEIDLN